MLIVKGLKYILEYIVLLLYYIAPLKNEGKMLQIPIKFHVSSSKECWQFVQETYE